jgi:hypothetical protein
LRPICLAAWLPLAPGFGENRRTTKTRGGLGFEHGPGKATAGKSCLPAAVADLCYLIVATEP